MANRNELRVQAVKRYRVPRYPSHLDPDPTQFPQRVPFPLKRKLLAAVASLGIASAPSCSPPTGGQTAGAKPTERQPDTPRKAYHETQMSPTGQPIIVTKDHALDVAFSGLPHRTSPYGTGVPNYIAEDLAREVIERVFSEEGYTLSRGEQYAEDGVAFEMHGFDQDKKIGYVFGSRATLDLDAYQSWMTPSPLTTQARVDAIIDAARYTPRLAPVAKELQAAKKIPDVGKQEALVEAILQKHSDRLLSLDEIKRLEAQMPKTKKFVAVISQFDTRFVEGYPDYKEMQELEKIPDVGKRESAKKELRLKAAQAAIEKLEVCVRDYIDWARSQGAG